MKNSPSCPVSMESVLFPVLGAIDSSGFTLPLQCLVWSSLLTKLSAAVYQLLDDLVEVELWSAVLGVCVGQLSKGKHGSGDYEDTFD